MTELHHPVIQISRKMKFSFPFPDPRLTLFPSQPISHHHSPICTQPSHGCSSAHEPLQATHRVFLFAWAFSSQQDCLPWCERCQEIKGQYYHCFGARGLKTFLLIDSVFTICWQAADQIWPEALDAEKAQLLLLSLHGNKLKWLRIINNI